MSCITSKSAQISFFPPLYWIALDIGRYWTTKKWNLAKKKLFTTNFMCIIFFTDYTDCWPCNQSKWYCIFWRSFVNWSRCAGSSYGNYCFATVQSSFERWQSTSRPQTSSCASFWSWWFSYNNSTTNTRSTGS